MLIGAGPEVHFDPALLLIPDGFMFVAAYVEVGFEGSVYSGQEVAVERCGDSSRIVVRKQKLINWFYEIGTEQEGVIGSQRTSNLRKKIGNLGALEVADVAAEKQHEDRAVAGALRCGVLQSGNEFGL